MEFLQKLLAVMDTEMPTPEIFGWFHILSLILTVAITVLSCRWAKNHSENRVRKTVLWVAVTVIILEVYKQINYTFSYEGGITADFQWYAFPWQFCSTPMYVGLLAGLLKKEGCKTLCFLTWLPMRCLPACV